MKDLTLGDPTQVSIHDHLNVTQELLALVATKVSGHEQTAEIWGMPDLGLPHNIMRIHGGFFTGALYSWQTAVPFVPIDATVNSCGVSVFRLRDDIPSRNHFDGLISKAIEQTDRSSSYDWNFESGNHFIIYGLVEGCADENFNGCYAVLHSSASEFKNQHNGLYPVQGNWYHPYVQTMEHRPTGRSLRYIEGRIADRFIEVAQHLEQFNRIRHRYFAELVFGEGNIETEIFNEQHYGMPTRNSVAIGCQWFRQSQLFILLTAPEHPLFFLEASASGSNRIRLDGHNFILQPHGLGKKATDALRIEYRPDSLVINDREYSLQGSLKNDNRFQLRTFEQNGAAQGPLPEIVNDVLKRCPATYVARLEQVYSYYRKACT